MKKICNHIMALTITIAFTSTGIYAQELEEIIVTATKRAVSLQDTPVSVSVISGDKIEKASIHSFTDVSIVPVFLTSNESRCSEVLRELCLVKIPLPVLLM